MSAVADVTDATFADVVLKSEKPVMVDFWADWCGPCKQVSPIIEELAKAFKGAKSKSVLLGAIEEYL
jgi:thioredoxin 1